MTSGISKKPSQAPPVPPFPAESPGSSRHQLESAVWECTLYRQITQTFFTTPDETVYAKVLDIVLAAFGCELGFLGYINTSGDLVCPFMTRHIWDEPRMPARTIVFPRNRWEGFWGKSLIRQETLFRNMPLTMPPGYVDLKNAMAVPIRYQEQLLGQIVMANGSNGFTPFHVTQTAWVAEMLAPILAARRQARHEKIERRKAQARLKARELELEVRQAHLDNRTTEEIQKLLRAVEESPASVLISDADGAIDYVNPKFCQTTGYTLEEVKGKNPRILNARVQPKAFYRKMWQTLSRGQEWKGEFCNRKKNGELYWEHASISALTDSQGKVTHYVAVKEDITEAKRIRQELEKAKEAAEAANMAKSDFLAGMSHELRTPLNSIIGFSEVLKDRFFGPLTDKQSEYIDDILGAGQHLLSLINDILDLSKVEAGKMTLEPEPVKIKDIIETGLVMIKEKTARHGITVQTDFKECCYELTLMADKRKLKQILFNILSNAAKFTPDGGKIIIDMMVLDPQSIHGSDALPEWLQPALHRDKTHPSLIISIADTGMGITGEDLPHIFEEFYQTRQGIQAHIAGTGLGLAITRKMVLLHGGKIWAHSDGPEKGSRFTLRLPLGEDLP